MTALQQLIEAQRARIATALTERATAAGQLDTIRAAAVASGTNTLTDEQVTQSTTARAEVARIDAQVAEFRSVLNQFEADQRSEAAAVELARQIGPVANRQTGGATIGDEPRVYTPHTARTENRSWFCDAYRSQFKNDHQAAERIERHGQEVYQTAQANGTLTRALTTGGMNGLVPPQYLTDLVATVLRNGRPLANAIGSRELPAEGMALVIPKVASGVTVASQATQNTAVSNTDLVMATDITVPIVTVAGYQDVSRQLLERGSGIDSILFQDLGAAYAAEVDRQIITGTGSSNQMLGILNTSGRSDSTIYSAVLTIPKLYSKLAGIIATIASAGAQPNTRGVAANLIAMHPRRWGWLTSQVDSTGRPLVTPLANGPYNATALNTAPGEAGNTDPSKSYTVVGSIQGLPVTTDANLPTAVGTESEDVVLVLDTTKALLWEDSSAPQELRFEQPLGNQLTVRMVGYGYAAFTAARYPVAFGKTGGLETADATYGLVAPTF